MITKQEKRKKKKEKIIKKNDELSDMICYEFWSSDHNLNWTWTNKKEKIKANKNEMDCQNLNSASLFLLFLQRKLNKELLKNIKDFHD